MPNLDWILMEEREKYGVEDSIRSGDNVGTWTVVLKNVAEVDKYGEVM